MSTLVWRRTALALLLVAGSHAAAEGQTTVVPEITGFAGATLFLTDPPDRFAIFRQEAPALMVEDGAYDDGPAVGFALGLRIAERFGVEGFFAWVPTDLVARSGLEEFGGRVDVNTLMYGVDVLYHFPGLAQVEPFVGLGVGGETTNYQPELYWERHSDLMGNVLVGTYVRLTDWMAIRLDARDCFTRFESNVTGEDDVTGQDLMLSVGMTFRPTRR